MHCNQQICQDIFSRNCRLQATFTTANTLVLNNASSTAQFYGKGELLKMAPLCMSYTPGTPPHHRPHNALQVPGKPCRSPAQYLGVLQKVKPCYVAACMHSLLPTYAPS